MEAKIQILCVVVYIYYFYLKCIYINCCKYQSGKIKKLLLLLLSSCFNKK